MHGKSVRMNADTKSKRAVEPKEENAKDVNHFVCCVFAFRLHQAKASTACVLPVCVAILLGQSELK